MLIPFAQDAPLKLLQVAHVSQIRDAAPPICSHDKFLVAISRTPIRRKSALRVRAIGAGFDIEGSLTV
jgi:hypothetical protein